MTFLWHCRECNGQGKATVTLKELREFQNKEKEIKTEQNLFKILTLFVKRTIHKGCSGDIGVKSV